MKILSWKDNFNKEILARGKQYYQSNRIGGFVHFGNTYRARINGSKSYVTEVNIDDPLLPRMSCTCPFDGNCKHEACVLFALEAMGKIKPIVQNESIKCVNPFKKDKNDGYEYFDLEAMTEEFTFYNEDVDEARKLVSDGSIEITDIWLGYLNSINNTDLHGRITGQIGDRNLYIFFSKDKIMETRCSIPGCYSGDFYGYFSGGKTRKLCVHEIALLLLFKERMKTEPIGDATDLNGNILLTDFRKTRSKLPDNQDISERNVILEPSLEYDGGELKLGFKIGTDKLFVLRKLEDFVGTVETKGNWPLGKKSSIDFSFSEFTESSQTLFNFIKNVTTQVRRRNDYFADHFVYIDSHMTVKDRIPLYGEWLDTFFEAEKEKRIPVTIEQWRRGKVSTEWLLTEGNPDISLSIAMQQDSAGIFHGIKLTGVVPQFIEGINYKYFVQDDCLYRVNAEGFKELEPLLKTGQDGKIEVNIGRKHLSEFYYRILPTIEKFVKVKKNDQKIIDDYLPPEAEFKFFLDMEDGRVFCKAKTCYGNSEFNLTDWGIDTKKIDTFRDQEIEQNIIKEIAPYFPMIDRSTESFVSNDDSDSIYDFLQNGIPLLMRLGQVQATDRFDRLNIRKKIPVSVGVSVKSDVMNLEIQSTELSQDELLDVLNSYRKKKKYHRLKNGEFVDLEGDNLQELVDLMDALHISPKDFVKGKMKQPLFRALYLDKMLEQCEDVYSERDTKFKQLIKNFKTVEDSDYEVPKSLQKILRKYQKYGYRWLRTLENCGFGGILADDMGLGKTLQVITFLLSHKEENNTDLPALIVTPASLVYNWREEFSNFAPNLTVSLIAGNQSERKELIENYKNSDVIVTSYDLLKRDIDQYEGKNFSVQVIDEAQYIKNHTTAAAKSVKLISARTKFALTGTPIENRLSELWSIFDYLMPGFLYSYDNFKKELETPIAQNKDEDATLKLKRMVSPFILRRLKGDVLKDLPDKLEENYYAVMEGEQQKLYDGQVVKMRQTLQSTSDDNFKKNKIQVLAELTKIRQICCDPSLLFEDFNGSSSKREVCMQLIENAVEGEHKVLLFSQFTSMLALLENDLTAHGIAYYKITGETDKEKRLELVQQFNSDTVPVFLISLKAGGTGLNLTGADIVIHYDPWWNVAAQNQATDRAHRIGQTKTVNVYRLIVKNSIEEKILKMQEEKKNLADAVLNGESSNLMEMTKEDLMNLLG